MRLRVFASWIGVVLLAGASAGAQERFDLGVRFGVLAGDGEPTNDVLGYGLVGRWPLGELWSLGVGLDHSPEFDVERTPRMLGIEQDPTLEVIDSKATSTGLRAWMERRYPRPGRLEWFWGAGAGVDSIDVDDVAGRDAAGGDFLIRTEAGTELHVGALAGLRFRMGRSWYGEAALRAEQHFADWKLTEATTGRTATVDDYLLTGIHFALSRRF
jgi:hypothetical protein